MITLDDCIAFCGALPVVVEEIAERQNLPLVLACAYAHGGAIGANDSRAPDAGALEQSRLVA